MNRAVFIAINDIHWRLANPRGRLDNYNEAIQIKLREIFQLAATRRATAILIAGDIVDTPGLGLVAISELAAILSESPCPILTIAGQHDEWGNNPETLCRTPYGLLRKLGFIVDVTASPRWFAAGNKAIRITGRHYDDEADIADDYYSMPSLEIDDAVTIHLSHGLVIEKKPGFDLRCTVLDNLKTDADLLCVGDYHSGIGIRKINKTHAINPGALGRLTAAVAEMHRPIQVSVVSIFESGEIKAELVPLQSARPGEEILSRDHLTEVAEREDRLTEFLALLADQGEMKFLNSLEMAEQLATEMQLPSAVVTEARARLTRAREELGVAV